MALFALWTVGCHLLVLVGLTARWLDAVAAAVFACLLFAIIALMRRPGALTAHLADAVDEPDPVPYPAAYAERAIGSVAVVFAVVAWFATHSVAVVWALSTAFFVAAATRLAFRLREGPPPSALRGDSGLGKAQRVFVVAASFFCAAASLLIFRPRSDDAFYLNMALSVVDHPDEVLFATNHLHGPATATLSSQPMFVPYRVHGFEALVGWIARVSGGEVAVVEHLILATLLASLIPFALLRLLRILAPVRWPLALMTVLVFYAVEGSSGRGYANQALVRMFHGKSAMLTLMTPLLCAYALRFAARPCWRRWVLLALSQITAVGLSSTALWWAPALSGLALLSGLRSLRGLGRLLAGWLGSALYVLLVAVWVKASLVGGVLASTSSVASAAARAPELTGDSGASLLGYAVPIVFGPERTAVALLVALGIALLSARLRVSAALFACGGAAVALIFANPWLAPWIATNVTGVLTYQRVFWLLPIPIAVSLTHVQVRDWLEGVLPRPAAALGAGLALLVFLLVATDRLVLSEANHATLRFPPTVKLWMHARDVAVAVCKRAHAGSHVLAPQAVMQQLGTQRHCGYPLLAGERWIRASGADIAERQKLTTYVEERVAVPKSESAWFVDSLWRYSIDLVVLSKDAMRMGGTKALLRWAGFERVAEVDWDHLWVRETEKTQRVHLALARAACAIGPDAVVAAPFGILRQLAREHCAKPLSDPSARAPSAPADREAVRLEALIHMGKELAPEDRAWALRYLLERSVGVVIVRRYAMSNHSLKEMLLEAGFAHERAVLGHHIFIRPR